jgi:hypothetical protein
MDADRKACDGDLAVIHALEAYADKHVARWKFDPGPVREWTNAYLEQ